MNATAGQQLRQAREARPLSLEEVSRATHIRLHYLRALEAGDFNALPSTAQARGFLRTYAAFLGLDAGPLLENTPEVVEPAPAPSAERPAPAQAQESASLSAEQAKASFVEIGQDLQRQRELLGLSLDDVERHTHLRRRYLQALETGDLEGLPSPVQGRGMLNNYIDFLGLDPEPLLLRFAEGLQDRLAAAQAARAPEPARPAPRRRAMPAPLRWLLSGDLLIGGTLAVFLVIFMVWGSIRIFAMRSEDSPSPTAPSIVDVLLATPTQGITPTPPTSTPTLAVPAPVIAVQPTDTEAAEEAAATAEGETPPDGVESTAGPDSASEDSATPGSTGESAPVAADSVQVYLTARQRAWVRVLVDGKVEFQGRVLPGSAYTFSGEERVEILTGNAAALQVFFNDQDEGVLGAFGEVVNLVYTLEGVQTPTVTVTATPTATARTTPTPPAAATQRPGTATAPALP